MKCWLTLMLMTGLVTVSHARAVSADDLFAVFVDLRNSVVFDHSIAQYEDPRFFSRGWLEDAIKSALNAAKQPDHPGLNWVQDSLLTKLSAAMAKLRDRARYFNESTLGTQVGLDVGDHNCSPP